MHEVQNGEVYLKFFTGALHSGLMGAMPADLWQTYCALAVYMDRDGLCYPSQKLLAYRLGVRRETIGRRIQKLLEFEWQGEKVLEIAGKHRGENQQFSNTIYRVNPNLAFRIF